MSDIRDTGRDQSESALRASEARFRNVIEKNADGIVVLSRDGVVRFMNPAAERLFGCRADDCVGTLFGIPVVPDERTEVDVHGGATPGVVAEMRVVETEWEGEPAYLASLRDVTDRKRAEEALRTHNERLQLLNEAASHLLTADNPDTLVRGLFERVRDHLGVDAYFNYMVTETGDALTLVSCAGIPEEAAQAIDRLEFGQAICGTAAQLKRPVVASGIQESNDTKVQLVRAFGIRAYACNPLLAGDHLLGTLSFASRTRDRFADDELDFLRTLCHYAAVAYERVRLIGQLRETDRRKDEFLAMLAHELRNPLAGIRTSLHVLGMPAAGPAAGRAREVAERQVGHLVRLVDDLLDVSRVTLGKIRLQKEPVDVAAAAARAAEAAAAFVEAQGHELSVSLPARPVWIEADVTRLEQVFANLLNNAAKYTPQGGRIWLTVERSGEVEVMVTVRDTGVGIGADVLPRVFDLFSQAGRSLDRSQGGLGIGLTLVRGLVELHGGAVEAHSDGPGQGSEFVVRLPALPQTVPATPAVGPTRPAGRSRRVLLVEDQADVADMLATLIRLWGHQVAIAHDGTTAVATAHDHRPEVVLLDIGLPGMNGYEVAERLRGEPGLEGTVLVALTGYGQEEDRRRSRAAGFHCHLVKPVAPIELEVLLAQASVPSPG